MMNPFVLKVFANRGLVSHQFQTNVSTRHSKLAKPSSLLSGCSGKMHIAGDYRNNCTSLW